MAARIRWCAARMACEERLRHGRLCVCVCHAPLISEHCNEAIRSDAEDLARYARNSRRVPLCDLLPTHEGETHTHAHTHKLVHTTAYRHTNTRTHTHARTHTRNHTHSHTRTHKCSAFYFEETMAQKTDERKKIKLLVVICICFAACKQR